jgi:hypothetical protein
MVSKATHPYLITLDQKMLDRKWGGGETIKMVAELFRSAADPNLKVGVNEKLNFSGTV